MILKLSNILPVIHLERADRTTPFQSCNLTIPLPCEYDLISQYPRPQSPLPECFLAASALVNGYPAVLLSAPVLRLIFPSPLANKTHHRPMNARIDCAPTATANALWPVVTYQVYAYTAETLWNTDVTPRVGIAYGALGSESSVVTASAMVLVNGIEPESITVRTAIVSRLKPRHRARYISMAIRQEMSVWHLQDGVSVTLRQEGGTNWMLVEFHLVALPLSCLGQRSRTGFVWTATPLLSMCMRGRP